MKLSSEWARKVRKGSFIIALAGGAYGLGMTSADKEKEPEVCTNIPSQEPPLRPIIDGTRKALMAGKNGFQEYKPVSVEKDELPSSQETSVPMKRKASPQTCNFVSQKKEVNMLKTSCIDFNRSYPAYQAIFENPSIDCTTISRIRYLAETQYQACLKIIKAAENLSSQEIMTDQEIQPIVKNAYNFQDKYGGLEDKNGNPDFAQLIKNPTCKTMELNILENEEDIFENE